VCYDDYNGQYELRDDCVDLADGSICHRDDAWQCEHSKEWYSDADDNDKFETPCGKTVHSDHADEYRTEETTEPTGE
jgi:hypothetical protein